MLLSVCLDDMIPSKHAVRVIDKVVDQIVSQNKELFEEYRENQAGRPSYHQSIMIKLFLYGYFNGIKSSRKLEAETQRNLEVMWLLGELKPDHWTISNYRKEHGKEIKYITKQIRRFLKENGYIKLEEVAIDGTKIKAYANREVLTINKINSKLENIETKIEEYITKLDEEDSSEDIDEAIDRDGIEPTKKKYVDEIAGLVKQIETLRKQKEIMETEQKAYMSATDNDANLMKTREGSIPAYNVQMAVDAEHKMVVATEVVTEETDYNMLPVMVKSVKEEVGDIPDTVIADTGYAKLDLIQEIEKREPGIETFVAVNAEKHEEITFTYDKEKDEYVCSQGKRLILAEKNKKQRGSLTNLYKGTECGNCPIKDQCTISKNRSKTRYHNQEWRDQYISKMRSVLAKKMLVLRMSTAEHPFGTIKCLMGKIPLLLRGIKKVPIEINLYSTAYNLKRLFNIEEFGFLMGLIAEFNWKAA